MLLAVVRSAFYEVLGAVMRWMCRPAAFLTQAQLGELARAYDASGLPPAVFYAFRNELVADTHYAALLKVMAANPSWVVPDTVNAAISGETWRMRIGAKVFEAFVFGTDCHCCLGWRLTLLALVVFVTGMLVG